jgi:hypothetical protein
MSLILLGVHGSLSRVDNKLYLGHICKRKLVSDGQSDRFILTIAQLVAQRNAHQGSGPGLADLWMMTATDETTARMFGAMPSTV